MEVQREPAEPKWQLRSQYEQETDKRQDAAHNNEQSAYLLHTTILRQRQCGDIATSICCSGGLRPPAMSKVAGLSAVRDRRYTISS